MAAPPFPAPRPKKQFGQHWLRSEAALQAIATAAAITAGDSILEIGPGTGILTQRLLDQAAQVTAVELDRHLCQQLRQRFRDCDRFRLIEGDILQLDLAALRQRETQDAKAPESWKVVANLPYYITGPILETLLGTISQPNPHPFEAIVVLVQKEVAERICAQPGSKIFGALSVRVQYLARCEWVCGVPARAFSPPPKVDSAVVKLIPRPMHPPADHPRQLETLVKVGFGTKRKMLRNNLKGRIERDRLLAAFEQTGIAPNARAEEVGTAQWVALSNQLTNGLD